LSDVTKERFNYKNRRIIMIQLQGINNAHKRLFIW